MEIKMLNISFKEKNKYLVKNLNLQINKSQITGIYQDNFHLIPRLLLEKNPYDGNILIDNNDIHSYTSNLIVYINHLTNETFLTKKVSDEFFLMKNRITNLKNGYIKKVVSSLNIVGLNETYLEKDFNTLSKSEKRLIQIALNLVIDPDIIIFEEPFLYLDKKAKFDLTKIILDLKRKYKKTIILQSQDINILYELTNHLIIFKDNKVLISDKTSTVFKDLAFLESNQIELPNIIFFNKIANKYGVKLTNSQNINDLIKDVYKNVCKVKKET